MLELGTILSIVSIVSIGSTSMNSSAQSPRVTTPNACFAHWTVSMKSSASVITFTHRASRACVSRQAQHAPGNLRQAGALLERVQATTGGQIISSRLIETPDKMRRVMIENPGPVGRHPPARILRYAISIPKRCRCSLHTKAHPISAGGRARICPTCSIANSRFAWIERIIGTGTCFLQTASLQARANLGSCKGNRAAI